MTQENARIYQVQVEETFYFAYGESKNQAQANVFAGDYIEASSSPISKVRGIVALDAGQTLFLWALVAGDIEH